MAWMKTILTDMFSTLILTIWKIFCHVLSITSHICDMMEECWLRLTAISFQRFIIKFFLLPTKAIIAWSFIIYASGITLLKKKKYFFVTWQNLFWVLVLAPWRFSKLCMTRRNLSKCKSGTPCNIKTGI